MEANLLNILKNISVIGVIYFVGYMGWSVSWFLGPIILSVIRDQWKKDKRRKRAISKATAVSDEKHIISATLKDLPNWVYFPDVEKAEWVNRLIKQVWPNINHYVRDLVREAIEPELENNLGKYKLTGFKFERIILGSAPCRVSGIKVYDKDERDQIVMDLDIFYDGDCDITFLLKGLKGGIKKFQLHGKLRVVMKPLINAIPLIGGLQVFFLNNPDIDFNLTGIADLLNTPGLSSILKRMVEETVASLLVLPNKFPFKISKEVDTIDVLSLEPEGILRVHVNEANNLINKDKSVFRKGKSDPYAVITVGAQEYKTPVVANSVNPKWDYWCEFQVLESTGQQLYIEIWDKDDTSSDESLGKATIEISNIVTNKNNEMWISLNEVKHGMVHLKFVWLDLSADYRDFDLILKETRILNDANLHVAVFTIFLETCQNLPLIKKSVEPHPYAVLRINNTSQQTKVIKKSVHPVWNQGFVFMITNPDIDTLFLSIVDQWTKTVIGQLNFKIVDLKNLAKLQMKKECFALSKSGPESKVICSMTLRLLKNRAERD